MVIGRDAAEWKQQSWLVATVRNLFSKSPVSPDSINPWLADARRQGWIDEVAQPRAPFSLSLVSIESMVDPDRRW